MAFGKIGIDFGTCEMKYCLYGTGIFGSEPCVAAVDAHTGRVLAYGKAALDWEGRESDTVRMVHAMQDGVIANYALLRYMARDITDRMCKNRIIKPEILAGISTGVTETEKRAMLDVLYDAGARTACLIEEPVAAVFGLEADTPPKGAAVLDVGGGTTDCAVVTMNSIAVSRSIASAGNAMTEEIRRYLRDERGVEIGFFGAEEIKKTLACAVMRSDEIALIVGGKRLSGEGMNFEMTSTEMRFVLKTFYEEMEELVVSVFDQTPPELLGDIARDGLLLTGGSAQIYGLADYLSRALHIPVSVPQDPARAVIRGIEKALPQLSTLRKQGFVYTDKT